MNPLDVVVTSFELAADNDVDINQASYELFIAASPRALALMDHLDEHMLGPMMQEVVTLLMSEDVTTQRYYLNFEVDAHRAYGVVQSMYRKFLIAVCDAIRSILGERWNQDYESAWEQRIGAVIQEIELTRVGERQRWA